MWKNSLYNTVGGLVRLVLGLISVPFLTRTLGVDMYGLYATNNAITNIALFSEWSLSSLVTVFLSKEIAESERIFGSKTKFQTYSAAAIFILFVAIATSFFVLFNASFFVALFENLKNDDKIILVKAIQLTSYIIGLRIIQQFFIGILQANKEYGYINIISTLYNIISILATLYAAAERNNIVVIQYYQLLITVVMTIFYVVFIFHLKYFSLNYFTQIKINYFIELSIYGINTWTASLGSTLFSQFDRLIILRLFGTEIAGIYSAITALANQINSISALPVQPLLPMISGLDINVLKTPDEIGQTFSKFSVLNAIVICSIGSGLIIFSDSLVNLLFTKNVININTTRSSVIIIACAYSLYSFNAVGYFSLLGIRDEKFITIIVIVSGLFSLFLIYIFSLRFGIIGACIGNFGYSLTLLLNIKAVQKLNINTNKYLKIYILPIGITFAFSLIGIVYTSIYASILLYSLLIIFLFLHVNKYIDVFKLIYKK